MKNTLKIRIDAPNFQCILHRGQRYGFEIKFNEAPSVRKSMRVALNDLKLDHLWVIYPGRHRYPVDDKITVLPIGSIHEVA